MPNENFTAVADLLIAHDIVPYVITKNWYELGDTTTELLVNDKKEFLALLGLKKDRSALEPTRTLYRWRYGVKIHRFEVRDLEDNYYHVNLGTRLLHGRVKHDTLGIYTLNNNDQFVEILYYCTYRLGYVPDAWYAKLLPLKPKDFKGEVDNWKICHDYLCGLGYFPIKCKDQTQGYVVNE